MRYCQPWTPHEIQILHDNYYRLGPTGVFRRNLLPGRTIQSIQERAKRMKLRWGKKPLEIKTKKIDYRKVGFGISDPIKKMAVCGSWR